MTPHEPRALELHSRSAAVKTLDERFIEWWLESTET
jgi:hypothetical protein